MALTSDNVRVAVTGLVAVGPTSADAPTNSGSTLDTDLVDLGYVGESGVEENRERTTKDLKAWQNGAIVRTVVVDGKYTLKFTMIETTSATMETFYGSTVQDADATDGRIDVVPTSTGGRKSWVVDVVDGSDAKRIYIAEGEVTEVGTVTYVNSDTIGYPITVTGYPVNGVSAQIWSTALASA